MYFKKAFSQQYFSDTKPKFGHNYFGYLSKVSGKWTGGISAKLFDQHYDNNDFGYLTRNNQLTFRANLAYTNNKPKKHFSWYQIRLDNANRYYYSLIKNEQTYYKLIADGILKKNNHAPIGVFTYVQQGKNFYEPRVKDRYFNKPAFTETVLEYRTNSNKNVYFASYMVFVDYLKSDIYTNEFVTGYGLQTRIGKHLHFKLEQDYTTNPNSAGFISQLENDIVFGKRSLHELTNSVNINYSVNAKLNMNMRLRHYWFQVDYNEQYLLLENGGLAKSKYEIDVNEFDDNFNSFNIDFLAKWQFAPASEITLGYKLGSLFYNSAIRSSYFDNLRSTVNERSNATVSFKVTYFLDSNKLR